MVHFISYFGDLISSFLSAQLDGRRTTQIFAVFYYRLAKTKFVISEYYSCLDCLSET